MLGFEFGLPGHDTISGSLMLLFWGAGVVTALVLVVAVLALRDFAMREMIDIFLRTAMVVVLAVLGWTWIDQSGQRERAAERRALEARDIALSARAVEPGTALACLNPIGIEAVDTACERAVFASPQTVAAAIAYVDARLALLADGLALAGRDPNYGAGLEGPRRALESDRYGIVAHVLSSRGCTSEECAAFKLLRYTSRVKANQSEHVFEGHVAQYAANWPANGAATATATVMPAAPSTVAIPPTASATPTVSRFSFPTSASIPPISIMSAEPTGSTDNASTDAPPAAAKKPPARRQTAKQPSQSHLPPPPAPTAAPTIPGSAARPQ